MTGTAQKIKQKIKEVTSPSPTPPTDQDQQHKSSSISNILHHKSNSTSTTTSSGQSGLLPPGNGAPIQPIESGDSIASNPSNYLTDQQLEQELVLEEMKDRQGSIGHQSLPEPGVEHGSRSDSTVSAPPSMPPPPPAEKPSGGMYGNVFGGGGGGGGKKKGSKQKFAERQARKKEALLNSAPPADPDWTAQLEKERQEEIQVIGGACDALGREIYEIAPDGHCMFNAISDQLYLLGLIPEHQAGDPSVTRKTAAQYMREHKDDFIAFLPSVGGEDTAEATEDGMMTDAGFEKYCRMVAETGEWGGEPEIQALSRAFQIPIHVIQRGPPTIVSHGGTDDDFGGAMTPEKSAARGEKVVRISYHRRMYGLGEHYNSLRKA